MPNIAHHHPRNELPKLEQQLSEEVFVIHAQLARQGTCCPREPTVQHFGGSVHLHCSGIVVCPMPLIAERRDWDVVCRGFLNEKNCANFELSSNRQQTTVRINEESKHYWKNFSAKTHSQSARIVGELPIQITNSGCLSCFHWRTKQKKTLDAP